MRDDLIMESPYNPIDDSIEEPASHEQIKELKDVENVNSHAEQLSNLLQNYVRTYKERVEQNSQLRHDFYCVTMLIFSFLSLFFPALILTFVWFGKISDISLAVALISAAASIVTSVIVLPKTIAEYLFSTEEDSKNADIVKEIIKSDLEIRNKLNSDDHTDGGKY